MNISFEFLSLLYFMLLNIFTGNIACFIYDIYETLCREHSLQKSCDMFPCCLVLRRCDNLQVIGFSQLVSVLGDQHSCIIESGECYGLFCNI